MASKPGQSKSEASKSQPSKDNKTSEVKGFSKEAEATRLPFEPAQTRKKPPKKAPSPSSPPPPKSKSEKSAPPKIKLSKEKAATPVNNAFSGIPEAVSKRMARRAMVFCGVPTIMGMLTFIVSYFVVSQNLYKLPTVAVLLVSLGFFGLGVLGLSYGAFSASWDENRLGTWFGFNEFRANFGRTIKSWQAAQQKPSP